MTTDKKVARRKLILLELASDPGSLIAPDTAVSDFFFVFCPGGKRQKRRPKDGTGVRSGSDRA